MRGPWGERKLQQSLSQARPLRQSQKPSALQEACDREDYEGCDQIYRLLFFQRFQNQEGRYRRQCLKFYDEQIHLQSAIPQD